MAKTTSKAKSKGKLIVISGFSGVGKGTVIRKLRGAYPYELSVSATTRQPREGEEDGVHYFFLTEETFQHWVEAGEFFEWAVYVGNYYGTPKGPVMKALDEGKDVLLEIEAEGAFQIKAQYQEAVLIYIIPPSFQELKCRLEGRGTESPERIARRLRAAVEEEIEKAKKYDFVVVNDQVDRCMEELHQITAENMGTTPEESDCLKKLEAEALEWRKRYTEDRG